MPAPEPPGEAGLLFSPILWTTQEQVGDARKVVMRKPNNPK
jgi:hypothetical protein